MTITTRYSFVLNTAIIGKFKIRSAHDRTSPNLVRRDD